MAPRRTWLLSRKAEEEDSQWESFLSSKRDALNRMKAGRQEALRRLGSDRTEERSINVHMSDSRDAVEAHKENSGRHGMHGMRGDFMNESREDPAAMHQDLDAHKLVEIFTVIEKRRWDDLDQLVRLYPHAASFPCPKNLRTCAKGNLMLHEVCRNTPPANLVSVLIAQSSEAVKAKGGKGYLPLHYACATGASLEVVERLVNAFPASIRTRDTNDLMIPLHFACKWGATTDVIDYLVRTHPEGKQVRDIYAKTPSDYASDLGQEERDTVLSTLGRSLSMSGSEVSSINLNDEGSDTNKQIRRELTSTKSKLKKLSKELNERERKFSLLYGKEKEKAYELEKQKDLLEHECVQARMIQDEQGKKIKLLEQEYVTLKALQETHGDKKVMLERQLAHLESGNNGSMTVAMKEQEIKYQALLKEEQEKIQDLESRAREAELTHRHYTMALLQEHEKEVSKFEELTSRFKVLESQLRREIEHEKNKRVSAQTAADSKGSEFKKALEHEKEKASFLEGHISKVNDLLEAEQKRFFELEGILKETLALENEQREEMEAEFQEKESQYQAKIDIEAKNRQKLEEAYSDMAEKLKTEIEKSAGVQAYEFELKKELEASHAKLDELQKSHDEHSQILAIEKERAQKLEEAEADTRAKLKAEQARVKDLEKNFEKLQHLLEMERASAAQLRDELKELQDVYEKEMKKVRQAQQAESSARSELRSLHQKVSSLEEEEMAIKTKAVSDVSRLDIATKECELLKSMLESEKDRVQTLSRSQEELRELLDLEKTKAKSLEQAQTTREALVEEAEDAENMEVQLMETEAVMTEKRALVTELKGDFHVMNKRLEEGQKSVEMLERSVRERDEYLQVEKSKFDALLKEHADIQAELEVERQNVCSAKEDALRYEALLEVEQDTVKDLQQMVDQAKVDLESKMEEVRAIEKDTSLSYDVLEVSNVDLGAVREEMAELRESLRAEREKIAVTEDLLEKERENVLECESLLEAQKHLSIADQSKIQELEKQLETLEASEKEAKALLEEECKKSTKLEEDHALTTRELSGERKNHTPEEIARKGVLLESEQNKVKALEHSCDQLMSLLDWEKKHVLSLQDKQQDLENDNEAREEEIAELKRDLDERQATIDQLSFQLVSFDAMRREIIRLTAGTQQRDVLLAAMLHSIGDASAIRRTAPVQRAEVFVQDRERIVGLDLAGFDDDIVRDRNAHALVPYNDSTRIRTFGRVVLPLIPIGGLIAYHHHDPTLLRDLSAQAGELSSTLRTNVGELSSSLGASAAIHMRELSARIDASSLREPMTQVLGIAAQASQRMNIRR
ncbi:MAG: hypothetical protein SGILL_000325 [Bacillariaceae sp.]